MRPIRLIFSVLLLLVLVVPLPGAVIVLCNRAVAKVRGQFTSPKMSDKSFELAPGEQRLLHVNGQLSCEWRCAKYSGTHELRPFAAYVFAETGEREVQFHEIGIGLTPTLLDNNAWASQLNPARSVSVVRVRLCVDDEQPLREHRWVKEYTERLEDASKILERSFGVKFEVVDHGKWDSDDKEVDFMRSLVELEREAPMGKADLVIGFTSQYQPILGRTHLGGGRGPITSHILMREWGQVVDHGERLELLLHELGHYLGASHSPENSSYMRPVIGRRTTPGGKLTGEMDPINTLIVAMFCEERFDHHAKSLAEFAPITKIRMHYAYKALNETVPADPSALWLSQFLFPNEVDLEAQSAAHVLYSLGEMAAQNAHRSMGGKQARSEGPVRLVGVDWGNALVKQAAVSAGNLPAELAPKALLVGLALGADSENTLATHSIISRLQPRLARLETREQRALRTGRLSAPCVHDRTDLWKHFVVMAGLHELLGEEGAWSLALGKEAQDAHGGSGFSFADLAADLAGQEFAKRVSSGEITLDAVRERFQIQDWVVAPVGLAEALQWKDFEARYGGVEDARFTLELEKLREQVTVLADRFQEGK